MNPKLSVVVPIYNVEKYLRECLDSVLTQNFRDFEIVCVDDGSTDGSTEILAEYAAKDSRLRVVRQKNGGLSVARNRGLDEASGEWVFFLDSDDVMEPNAMEWMVQTSVENNLDILHFGRTSFYEPGVPHNPYEDKTFFKGIYDGHVESGQSLFLRMMKNGDWIVCVWTRLFRVAFLHEKFLRFHEGIIHEDEPYSLIADLLAERTARVYKIALRRRVRAGSIMTGMSAVRHLTGILCAYGDIAGFVSKHSFKPEIVALVRRRLAEMLCFSAKPLYESIPVDERAKILTNPDEKPLPERFAEARRILTEMETEDERVGLNPLARILLCWKERGFRYTLRRIFGKKD